MRSSSISLGLASALLFSLIGPGGAAASPPTSANPDPQHIVLNRRLGGYEVSGTGNPAIDPRNIQWAVDRSEGGSVYLRGTFECDPGQRLHPWRLPGF